MLNQFLQFYQASSTWSKRYGVLAASVALCVLTLGLFYWRIIRGYTPPVFYAQWPAPPDWVQLLYNFRWVVRAILIAAGLGLFWLELAGNVLSRLVQQLLLARWKRVLFIGLFMAIIATFIFQPGNYMVADNRPNVSAPWAALQAIQQGQPFVFWTTYVHLGGPFMQFHNSLYYYFAALVGLFIHNFFDVAEVSSYLLVIASGFSMYLYAWQLTGSRLAGLVAAVAYCGSYDRFQILALAANVPVGALWFVFLPLPFYFIERICSRSPAFDVKTLALLSLSVGANVWTHPLQGAWTVGFSLAYALIRESLTEFLSWRQHGLRIASLIGAHLGGVLIGIYHILPVMLEGHLAPTQPRTEGVGLDMILNPDLATGWGGHYIGISILVIALLGAALIIILKQKQAYALALLAALPFFLAVGPHYFPFINDVLAVIPFGNLIYARGADRYLYIALMALAALSGLFVSLLPSLWAKLAKVKWVSIVASWPPERIGILVITAILVESVPLTMWYSYKSPDSYLFNTTGRWPIVDTLAQTSDKTARVFDAGEGSYPSFIYPMLTGHPSLSGHYEEAPPSFETTLEFEKRLDADLANDHISPDTANLLYQLNVGYVVTNGTEMTLPELELMQRTDSATLWRVPFHSPIVATTQPSSANGVTVTAPTGGDVPVTLNRQVETATTVTMDFSLPKRAFVQISYSAYPYQRVLLDGQPITVTPTPLGLIGFWAEAGIHTIEVLPELSPLRKITLAISAITFLVAAALAVYPNRQR